MSYKCSNCGQSYESSTQDGFCTQDDCYGIGILEEETQANISTEGGREVTAKEIGLCIMACDASYSMTDTAFPNSPSSRMQLVSRAVSAGISDLYSGTDGKDGGISKPEQAYIAIIGFGKTATLIKDKNGNPFVKSISEIKEEFPTRESLAEFLEKALTDDISQYDDEMRYYTDISKALSLADEIRNDALNHDLSKYGINGDFSILHHDIVAKKTDTPQSIPNVRVLIYSDGSHNSADNTSLINSFDDKEDSPLMTVFFGSPDDPDSTIKQGADEMKSLSCLCPIHNLSGYFLISDSKRYAMLRGLFRMASGASGFCPSCLVKQSQAERGA